MTTGAGPFLSIGPDAPGAAGGVESFLIAPATRPNEGLRPQQQRSSGCKRPP